MFVHIFGPKIPVATEFREKVIAEVVARLRLADPLRAIVFGSYADGNATADSDLDVLVICRDARDIKIVRKRIYENLKRPVAPVPIDFIFIAKGEYEIRRTVGGVCMVAHEQGFSIYEATA